MKRAPTETYLLFRFFKVSFFIANFSMSSLAISSTERPFGSEFIEFSKSIEPKETHYHQQIKGTDVRKKDAN